MSKRIKCVIVIAMLAAVSCNRGLVTAVESHPGGASGESDIVLRYRVYSDQFGSDGASGNRIVIENRSDRELYSCVITINETYTVSMGELLVGGAWMSGPEKRGYDNLEPNSSVSFALNHDVSNALMFVDAHGNRFSPGSRIEQITLEYDSGKFSWELGAT